MTLYQRWGIVGACFLAAALAVLAVEIRLIQGDIDAVAHRMSLNFTRTGGKLPDILQPVIQRWRLESMDLFDHNGHLVHESLNVLHRDEERGLLVSLRAGVRDLHTGQEVFHIVAHRDIYLTADWAGLAGLGAALLAGLVLWLAGRRREAAPA